MPNISVIITSYNRCHSLPRALGSVSRQTLPAKEIILVDDGSTDATSAMLKTDFPDIQYYYQPNQGVSAARNLGIQHATGEWLAFLDSDDEWLPEKLEKQMARLATKPDMKICHTEEIWIRHGRRVNAMKKHAKKGGWIFQHCLPLCAISPSSILLHRSVFERIGLFDQTLPACEDYDLWLRMTACFPVLFIEEALIVKYGGHADQLSRKFWGMDRFRIRALEKIIADSSLSHENRQAAIQMLIKKCRIYIKGAEKRGKNQEVNRYQQLLHRYVNMLEESHEQAG